MKPSFSLAIFLFTISSVTILHRDQPKESNFRSIRFDSIPKPTSLITYNINGKNLTNIQVDSIINEAIKNTLRNLKTKPK